MRRNRKNNIRKERIIMIASSAFVMAALTMTGFYMKEQSGQNENDGYSLDFSEMEKNVNDKADEIAQKTPDVALEITEDDLDYDPLAAGSSLVEIPGLTDKASLQEEGLLEEQDGLEELTDVEAPTENRDPDEADKEEKAAGTNSVIVTKEPHFGEEESLVRPVAGEILMHYSMDSSVYFTTLDQYKYNPAVVFRAEEGEQVRVCADGKVVSVFENEELGKAVTLDLGDGYQVTYGQLKDLETEEGHYVNSGEVIGFVGAPTKYYSLEGTNLYFQMEKDGDPVNPEERF